MVPTALGLKNSIYCGIIKADIYKIIFVFPQPFINNEIKDLDCTPGSWVHFIFCYMLQKTGPTLPRH
jgi:hypothetical protein